MRLYKRGYRAKMFDSITLEECPNIFKSWIKQRSRWIKGHLQTYFVHLRSSKLFFSKGNWLAFISFNSFLIFPILAFIFPFLSGAVVVISYFYNIRCLQSYAFLAEANGCVWIIMCCVSSWILAAGYNNFWRIITSFLFPFYFGMHGIAALLAIAELFIKPHHWHKTPHGYKSVLT